MREWSTYCQNADFLEKSRMLIMNRDMSSQVVDWIGIKPGDKVLDVGCGSGELTFYLADATDGVSYVGVDLDDPLLERAEKKSDTYCGGCKLSFIHGNALVLPFADGSFDVVVSQTLLTSIADYEKVVEEMRRVCRPGGRIATLNPLNFRQFYNHPGNYPADAVWATSYHQCMGILDRLCNAYGTMGQYVSGVIPMKVPELFAHAGLKHVSAHPIGAFLSLSNDAMTEQDKRRYIMLDCQAELDKFNANMRLPDADAWVSAAEARQVTETLTARRDYLLEHLDDNRIWEWLGTTFLLVVGEHTEAQAEPSFKSGQTDTLREETSKYKAILDSLKLDTEEKWNHSGAGRTASVRISLTGTDISVAGFGITPVHAMAHGYRNLMALLETGAFGSCDTALWNSGKPCQTYSDEKLFTAEDLEVCSSPLLEETLLRASKGFGAPLIDMRTTAQKLGAWNFSSVDGKFVSLPFEHLTDGMIAWLPEVLRSAYYGTNGIGAGLTEQDAMVNGLCSIAERLAVRKILLEGQTPPLLPEKIIHTLPDALVEAICALKHTKNCTLRLLDASCGIGLPVVAAMLIEQRYGAAIVRFAAHPKMELALSHCIAALMVEQDYNNLVNMNPVSVINTKTVNYPRQFNLMQDDRDIYPASLVKTTPSWDYRPWKEAPEDVSGQMEQLISLYQDLNMDIYVRKCGFLGVPAVQVIVPGVSMLHDFGTVRMQERRMAVTTKHTLRNISKADPEEQKRALRFTQMKMGWRQESRFSELSGIPYSPTILGIMLDAAMFYALIQLHNKEYNAALEVLKHYARDGFGNPSAVGVLCEMVKAVQNGEQLEKINEQFAVLYPDTWVAEATRVLRDPLGALPALSCPDCSGCSVKHNCKMQETLTLMQRLQAYSNKKASKDERGSL